MKNASEAVRSEEKKPVRINFVNTKAREGGVGGGVPGAYRSNNHTSACGGAHTGALGIPSRLEEQVLAYPTSVPAWMVNRPVDVYTGVPKHLYGSDLALAKEDDINLMKKMRCYRGIRHENGLKVRGQCTKSTGRFGKIVGVSKRRNA